LQSRDTDHYTVTVKIKYSNSAEACNVLSPLKYNTLQQLLHFVSTVDITDNDKTSDYRLQLIKQHCKTASLYFFPLSQNVVLLSNRKGNQPVKSCSSNPQCGTHPKSTPEQ